MWTCGERWVPLASLDPSENANFPNEIKSSKRGALRRGLSTRDALQLTYITVSLIVILQAQEGTPGFSSEVAEGLEQICWRHTTRYGSLTLWIASKSESLRSVKTCTNNPELLPVLVGYRHIWYQPSGYRLFKRKNIFILAAGSTYHARTSISSQMTHISIRNIHTSIAFAIRAWIFNRLVTTGHQSLHGIVILDTNRACSLTIAPYLSDDPMYPHNLGIHVWHKWN